MTYAAQNDLHAAMAAPDALSPPPQHSATEQSAMPIMRVQDGLNQCFAIKVRSPFVFPRCSFFDGIDPIGAVDRFEFPAPFLLHQEEDINPTDFTAERVKLCDRSPGHHVELIRRFTLDHRFHTHTREFKSDPSKFLVPCRFHSTNNHEIGKARLLLQ